MTIITQASTDSYSCERPSVGLCTSHTDCYCLTSCVKQTYFPIYGKCRWQTTIQKSIIPERIRMSLEIRRMLFHYLINWNVETKTTIQPKTILASVRFNVCVMLFSMNWTSGQALVKSWACWPLVPEVKKHTDCKPKWRSSAWWQGATFHLRHNHWHLSTCDPSLPPSHSVFPISELTFFESWKA